MRLVVIVAMIVVATVSMAPVSTAGATDPAMVAVGNAPVIPAGSANLGSIAASTPLSLIVVLAPRDQAALTTFIDQISEPSSAEYHHYLAKGQFGPRFGAKASTIAQVTATLASLGLTVDHVNANDLFLPVSTTAGRAQAAFDVSIHNYRLASKRVVYADTAAPNLPSTIASDVVGILGLSNVALPQPVSPLTKPLLEQAHADRRAVVTRAKVAPDTSGPTACSAAATDSDTYTAGQLAHAYGLDTGAYANGRLGAGETIAVYEESDFYASDLAAYDSCYGISPTVNVKLVGGADPGVNGALIEAELDIEDIEGLAPDAAIDVYETADNDTETYFPVGIQQIATDDTAQVVSISYGVCEPSIESPLVAAFHSAFSQMAAQGQSVFVASGDAGSEGCDDTYDGSPDTLSVSYPGSDSYVTSVGGTDLWGTSVPPPESAWNDHQICSDCYTGGGGGISTFWQMPTWQQAVGVNSYSSGEPCGAPTGSYCREVPDVSAMAGGNTGYAIYCTYDYGGCDPYQPWTVLDGTSAAAPLWAALTALVDEGCSAPAGFVNPALYTHESDLNDINVATYDGYTISNNDATGTNGGLFPVTTGYDMATGLGSPTAALFTSGVLCGTVPGAPTIGTATAGNAQASVTFTAPSDIGGASISSYTVTASDSTNPSHGGETGSGSASPISVSGLNNGDSYTFTVKATNTNGTGASSAPSNSVKPLAPPEMTSFSPSSGHTGTVVSIKGTNLSGAKVTIDGKVATITSDTATKIKVKVPASAKTGYIQVTTPGGTSKSATKFKVP